MSDINDMTEQPNPQADGYAVVQADGFFVGIWQTKDMAEQVQKRDRKSIVCAMRFCDAALPA
jgi:hypothetical protein